MNPIWYGNQILLLSRIRWSYTRIKLGCYRTKKVYSGCRKKRSDIQTFFSTTTYAPLPHIETLLWKAV